MAVDYHVRTFLRAHPRHSLAVQLEHCHGDESYEISRFRQKREWFIRALLPGDIVEVYFLFLLAEPGLGRAGYADLRDTLWAMDGQGVRGYFESATGRYTEDDPQMREYMVFIADSMIRNGGRRPKRDIGSKPAGRPPRLAEGGKAIAERAWWDRRHRTKGDVVRYLAEEHGIKVSHSTLFRLFGARN